MSNTTWYQVHIVVCPLRDGDMMLFNGKHRLFDPPLHRSLIAVILNHMHASSTCLPHLRNMRPSFLSSGTAFAVFVSASRTDKRMEGQGFPDQFWK